MLMRGDRNHLCIFCRWVEVRPWDLGHHGRCLGCSNPRYLRGMAKEHEACSLFEREPGADDELERELQWSDEPLHRMAPTHPAAPPDVPRLAPVRLPPPRPPRQPEPLSRAIMADFYPHQDNQYPRSTR